MNFNFINIFKKYGIELTTQQYAMFKKYYELLLEENAKYNLTTITSENDVWFKHFLDSVLPCKLFESGKSVLDIGGGAGFPSIPLKIVRPDLKITIIDSVQKKTNFMQMVVNELQLDNINVIHTRCEDMAKSPIYRDNFDYVVARAVAPLSTLLEYTAPLCKIGGDMILYKGDKFLDEITNSQNACKILDCQLIKTEKQYIEEYEYYRYFLIYTKNSATNKKYPRGQNKPRLNPLN